MRDAMTHAKRTFAAVAFGLLGACSVLPPSLRPAQPDKPLPEPAQSVASQAAVREQAAKDGAPPIPDNGVRI
jgi:hypothetical protein